MSAPTDSLGASKAGASLAEGSATENSDAPPANAVSVALKKKEPPPESAESIRLRAYVIASFWAIVIFVGLPIWWRTTAIYRASLPIEEMMEWADGRVCCKRNLGEVDANANAHRHVDQSFPYEYPSKQTLSKKMRPSIFCGRLSMRWMI